MCLYVYDNNNKKHICQLQLMRQIESDKKIIKTQIKMNYK